MAKYFASWYDAVLMFLRLVTSKFQVSFYVFILDLMDAALCEDFKLGLLFKFRQEVPEIFHFMYPQKCARFGKD